MNFIINENVKFGGWSIDLIEWEGIAKILKKYEIKSVVEFGMGTSTELFRQLPGPYLGYETRIETTKDFPDLTIYRRDLRNRLENETIEHDKNKIGINKFDLAFVDGPPAHVDSLLVNGCARYYSVEAAIKMSDKILIHDTRRPGETKTIAALLQGWHRKELPSQRGLTLFSREPLSKPKEKYVSRKSKRKIW